jgi:hypothetical protein
MNWSDERAELAERVLDLGVKHRLDSRQIARLLNEDEKLIKRIFHAWSVLGIQFGLSHSALEKAQQIPLRAALGQSQ